MSSVRLPQNVVLITEERTVHMEPEPYTNAWTLLNCLYEERCRKSLNTELMLLNIHTPVNSRRLFTVMTDSPWLSGTIETVVLV